MRYENEIVGKHAGLEKVPDENADGAAPEKSPLLLVRDIAITLIIIVLLMQFVRPTIVFGHSMENTLHPEDFVVLAKHKHTGTYLLCLTHGDVPFVFKCYVCPEPGN